MNSPAQTKQPATKPAHTPSAGAIRAAKAIFTNADMRLESMAQIIDRETAHAELVALNNELVETLKALVLHTSFHLQSGHDGAIVQNEVRNSLAVLARAALAKAQA